MQNSKPGSSISSHILIVEDSPDVASFLKRLLEREGFTVDSALNGREALEFLRATPGLPAVIILDLVMPVMDGYQFRQEQERDGRLAPIPIIVMASEMNLESIRMRLGAKASIRKPIEIKDVVEAIKRLCL